MERNPAAFKEKRDTSGLKGRTNCRSRAANSGELVLVPDASAGLRDQKSKASACVRWDGGKIGKNAAPRKGLPGEFVQNGFTITRMTMAAIRTAGISFMMRQWRADLLFRSSAKARTADEK